MIFDFWIVFDLCVEKFVFFDLRGIRFVGNVFFFFVLGVLFDMGEL